MPGWLDIGQILWMLAACWACFAWGKTTGITNTLTVLLEKKIITESDLERLGD